MEASIDFCIESQPDDTTCGPTCLHAVYRHFGDHVPLHDVVRQIPRIPSGGTYAANLGNHALRRGYRATIYTYNLQVFDPTWFGLPNERIAAKLEEQARHKESPRLRRATKAYIEFLRLGGEIRMEDLRASLLRKPLKAGLPILTGLSSTYLYRTPREYGEDDDWDDVRGDPQGHFVVVCGYDSEARQVRVADPFQPNPAFDDHLYTVPMERLVTAMLLGIVTYDANFLIVKPPSERKHSLS